jgi:streptogrisin C
MQRTGTVLLVSVLAVTGAALVPSGAGAANDSIEGIRIISSPGDEAIPKELRVSYAALDALSEANPDDFGFPTPSGSGTVRLPVATARGRSLLAQIKVGVMPPPRALKGDAPDAVGKRSRSLRAAIAAVGASAGRTASGKGVSAAQLRADTPVSAASGAKLTAAAEVVPTHRSRAQIQRDSNDLIDWSADRRFTSADIWQTSVERSTGRVVVTASRLTKELAAALVATYGTSRVVVQQAPNPHLSPQYGRLADASPYWGGARIKRGTEWCSDAFSWRVSSVAAMVTAGHCVPDGGSVTTWTSVPMGSVTSRWLENWDTGTGTAAVPNFTGHHGDAAIIKFDPGYSSSPSIYRGALDSSSSSRVLGMWSRRAQAGDTYCTGGTSGGEICGWTVEQTGINLTYTGGEIARNMVLSQGREGWCTRRGDSGGSVFTTESSEVRAKGVHSAGGGGGPDFYGGPDDKCVEAFTDIWDVYYGLPGAIA